jgi:urea transport system substrate-binding protein
MEAAYIGVNIWRQAVEQAGSVNVDAVRQAIAGQYFLAPGGWVQMDEKNHHLKKPVIIGEILADGQFQEVWRTKGLVRAEPWSKFVKDSKDKVADWTFPHLSGNDPEPKFKVPAHP